MEKVHYKGWENCYKISNGIIDLIVTTDVGPRVIFFGLTDGVNVFKNYDDMVGKTGGDEWRIYGGHRLWHAPEQQPRTYQPDNSSVKIVNSGAFVRLIQNTENATGIEKQIDIYLDPANAEVKLVHRLINHNLWGIELAPWALSVMAPGGKAIIPFPKRGSHTDGDLLPSNTITLWPYTFMSDPRWTWGKKYLMLQSEVGNEIAQKVGTNVTDGWAAYVNQNVLFVKFFDYNSAFEYADMGCNVETFTNEAMLELETLGAMCWLEPSEGVEHIEIWKLFGNVPTPQTEEDVDTFVMPYIR